MAIFFEKIWHHREDSSALINQMTKTVMNVKYNLTYPKLRKACQLQLKLGAELENSIDMK